MDNLHKTLLVLLGIAIILLGISAIRNTNSNSIFSETEQEPEIWSTTITSGDFNSIADVRWLGELRNINSTNINSSEELCLNICGNRCLWLGYSYKNHSVFPGTFSWGDDENPICSCDCYVDKNLG